MKIVPFLQAVIQNGASDLHIKAGSKPMIRINGDLYPLDVPPLTADEVLDIAMETMKDDTRETFLETNEADYALGISGLGRFRVNAFRARGAAGMILRHVIGTPKTLEELGMPPVLSDIADNHRGLVLVTGPTGSGKSSTLAAMINRINETRRCHILTIEDPIEYLHHDKLASVTQREVLTDTSDFIVALRAAMRQDPDVIMIGEMRDIETVRAAVQAAETGHLVMSTLHTTTAGETINRIIDLFPPHEQGQIRLSLAEAVKGIVCQRLLKSTTGGRVAAMEIAVGTNRIAEAIADPEKTSLIEEIIAEGNYYGMKTFQQDLIRMVLDGSIDVPTAQGAASNLNDLNVHLRRAGVQV